MFILVTILAISVNARESVNLVLLTGGGVVASWLGRSSPDQTVRVRALAGDIVLCCWARHFTTLTVPLSTQEYRWVLANLMLRVTLRWTSIPSRGSRNIFSRIMLQKPEMSVNLMGHALMQTYFSRAHRACSPFSQFHSYFCNMTRQVLLSIMAHQPTDQGD